MSDEAPISVETTGGIATITLDRPAVRNAINPAMRQGLWQALEQLETDADVAVIVLTGADPAFCAGIDLKLLGSDRSAQLSSVERGSRPPFPLRTKPLIGAINGAAITGGFELALNCDFLIASDRAVFADTHARVGVMPGWGLTTLLADAVGRRRAREISLTGNFVTATEALQWGLVNRVVPHDELLATVHGLATDIVDNDPIGVRQMLGTYATQEAAELADGWRLETEGAAAFNAIATPGAAINERRAAIVERGRRQL